MITVKRPLVKPAIAVLLPALCSVLLFSGCGDSVNDSSQSPQTEPYQVEILEAHFPKQQRLAKQTALTVVVHNAGNTTMPNVSVSVNSFSQRQEQPNVQSAQRPIWIVDQEPEGGGTALVETWSLGRLEPGESRTFKWQLTPVATGEHTVKLKVSGDLTNTPVTRTLDNQAPEESFNIKISD